MPREVEKIMNEDKVFQFLLRLIVVALSLCLTRIGHAIISYIFYVNGIFPLSLPFPMDIVAAVGGVYVPTIAVILILRRTLGKEYTTLYMAGAYIEVIFFIWPLILLVL